MDELSPEAIREARLTAIAAIRLSLQDRPEDLGRLLRDSQDVEGVAMAMASIGAALVVPAAMLKGDSPYAWLDAFTEWAVCPIGEGSQERSCRGAQRALGCPHNRSGPGDAQTSPGPAITYEEAMTWTKVAPATTPFSGSWCPRAFVA